MEPAEDPVADQQASVGEGTEPRRWLTRGVGSVGLASFFSDSGHEITTSILPTFVTVTLRSSAGVLGLIEGVSDALTGLAKLFAGPLANDQVRRLQMASGGYLVTAAATGAIGLAATVWQAGLLRATAWLARGVRSPARDAMLASLAPPAAYGRAFGLERAGDNLGAVVGPLLAAGLVAWLGVRPALYLAAIPGMFAALAIISAAREARKRVDPVRRRFRLELSGLRAAGVMRPLLPIAAFELGNMATTLLILRATTLLHAHGRSLAAATSLAVLIYAGHNLFGSLVAYAGGHWIDRAGPRIAFGAGAFLYLGSYVLFAVASGGWPVLVVAFLLAGSGIGLAETAESALVARLLPDRLRGSGFWRARRRAVARRLRLISRRWSALDRGLAGRRLPLRRYLDVDRRDRNDSARNDRRRVTRPMAHRFGHIDRDPRREP